MVWLQRAVWPTTSAADWCSEHRRRPHDRDQLIEPLPHDVANRRHEQ
jgi:hypothetical protein